MTAEPAAVVEAPVVVVTGAFVGGVLLYCTNVQSVVK